VLVNLTAPSLDGPNGTDTDKAAKLLVAAGQNPQRLRSEASWAHLCGVSPIPTGSGTTSGWHRLNRGGDRQANAALYRNVLTRMSRMDERDPSGSPPCPSQEHPEIMRCLKRYIPSGP
jgi:hypothetical protein